MMKRKVSLKKGGLLCNRAALSLYFTEDDIRLTHNKKSPSVMNKGAFYDEKYD
jgi:hypothetical protein